MPEFNLLQDFHFLRPWWLLTVIPFLFIYRFFFRQDDSLAYWRKTMNPNILQNLTLKGNQDDFFSPRKLYLLLSLLVVLVLAGPSWKQQLSPFAQDQSAVVIALDVSTSMKQKDLPPNRLLRAKQKINQLLAHRGHANTALIAFAGSAHIVMPITDDKEMIRHFLDVLDGSLLPKRGKLPQTILPLAETLLESTGVPSTLVLLTDAVTGEAAQPFKTLFTHYPHQLIVWGIGKSEPEQMSDKPGQMRLQIEQLNNLAKLSQGTLITFTHNDDDISKINRLIENHLVISNDNNRPWQDEGYLLVFFVAALQLFWFRRGWTPKW